MKICFADYALDLGTRLLSRSGMTVHLSPKAFQLLKLLVERRPNAVSKSELHERIWPGTFVSDDSLSRLIVEVREAVDDDARKPRFVRTVHGFGYAFSADAEVVDDNEAGANRALGDGVGTAESADQRIEGPAVPRWTSGAMALLAVAMVAALAAVPFFFRHSASTPLLPTRFIVEAPEGTAFSPSASLLAVSPNGRLLAFLAARPGEETRLWVRALDSLNAHELAGTDGARGPFWSPDSQSLGFFVRNQLKTVSLLGEPPRALCAVQSTTPSGTWSQNGLILFSHSNAIFRVSSIGGVPSRITSVDSGRGETAHILPQFLPDGRHFIYLAKGAATGARNSWIVSESVDGAERQPLIRASSQAVYAEPGYLFFLDDGVLVAQPFDAAKLQPQGAPLRVREADRVGFNPATPRGMFSVSAAGTLAYRPSTPRELGWYDRRGTPLGWIGERGRDSDPALSPDGQRVAVSRYDPATSRRDIWILDLARNGMASPFNSHLSWTMCPVWSSDGTRIAFASMAEGSGQLDEQRVDGGSETHILATSTAGCPLSWSPAGQVLYSRPFSAGSSKSGDVWFIAAAGNAEPKSLAGPWPAKPSATLSPNGHWIAYTSAVSGRNEIYVRSFPAADDDPQPISVLGGVEPEWRADGKELFFIAADKQLMAVPVTTEREFRAETPSALFATNLDPDSLGISGRNQYVASAFGERFLINQARPGAPSPPVTVLLNWTAALER